MVSGLYFSQVITVFCTVQLLRWTVLSYHISLTNWTGVLPQFLWPQLNHNITPVEEVASSRPSKSQDWEGIARTLSVAFSTLNKALELTGRAGGGYREQMERLLDKFRSEDSKPLKR